MSLAALAVTLVCRTPTLGAEVTNISHSYRAEQHIPDYVDGALVRTVRSKGPAAKAGLEAGDVIQAVDRDLIQSKLKQVIVNLKFGVEQGDQIEMQRDPVVRRAIQTLSEPR